MRRRAAATASTAVCAVLLLAVAAGCATEPDRDFYDVRFVTRDWGTVEGQERPVDAPPPEELAHDGSIRVMEATGFYADQGGEKMFDLRFGAGKAMGLAVQLDGDRWSCDYGFDLAEGYGRRQVTGSGTFDGASIAGTFRIEDARPDGTVVPVVAGRFEGERASS